MHMSLQPLFNNVICGKSTNEGSSIGTLKTDSVRSLNKCSVFMVYTCVAGCVWNGGREASFYEDVLLVEFMSLVLTHMPGESDCRRFMSLVLCACDVLQMLMNLLLLIATCDPWPSWHLDSWQLWSLWLVAWQGSEIAWLVWWNCMTGLAIVQCMGALPQN